MNKWLDNLKVGDEVVVSGHNDIIEKVTGVTRTQITIKGTKYRRDSGRQITQDKWHHLWLVEPTEEARVKIKHQNEHIKVNGWLRDFADTAPWRKYTLADKQKLQAAIQAVMPVEVDK